VPDYIVDRLSDEDAELVENHLLECKDCRDMYLTILFTRERGRRRRLAGKQESLAQLAELDERLRLD
jgi:predicted anti-sigma-YlaC factor YlaD